nr:hypothetical protein [Micromonospora sp. DSM 115978]
MTVGGVVAGGRGGRGDAGSRGFDGRTAGPRCCWPAPPSTGTVGSGDSPTPVGRGVTDPAGVGLPGRLTTGAGPRGAGSVRSIVPPNQTAGPRPMATIPKNSMAIRRSTTPLRPATIRAARPRRSTTLRRRDSPDHFT